MFNFDTQIHLSDVIVFGSGLLAFLKIGIAARDSQRDTASTLVGISKLLDRHGVQLDLQETTMQQQQRTIDRHEYIIQEERRHTPDRRFPRPSGERNT